MEGDINKAGEHSEVSDMTNPCLWAWPLGTRVEAMREQHAELAPVAIKQNVCQN